MDYKQPKAEKYFAYLRKSSEKKERQALSIPAQKQKIMEHFPTLDIEFIVEEKSSFTPYIRPKFSKMLERIQKGERTGLVAWHPDRLSRNEIDASAITYMVRKGVIEHLAFCTYTFENTPEGIMMLQFALNQSQYESAKKGRDVKKGLLTKAQMGHYPAPAPAGYLNETTAQKGFKTIYPDPERFALVRRMFDLVLTQEETAAGAVKVAKDLWSLRRENGKPISRSAFYTMLTNPFYYGRFEYPKKSGKWYDGKHKAMITEDEFNRIQEILGRNDKPRPKTHKFTYRGPIHCGECGCMITAEKKTKHQKNGNVHTYIYYHCTKKKGPCSQGSLTEPKLEQQLSEELKNLEIPTAFKEWALARLKEMNEVESTDRNKIYGAQERSYKACVRKIDNLIDMRANDEINEEQFARRKEILLKEKEELKKNLDGIDKRVENWLEIAEMGFNFAEKAASIFADAKKNEDTQVKKEILESLGSNLLLTDKNLSICWDNLLFPIQKMAQEARSIQNRLEPLNTYAIQGDLEHFYAQSPVMLPG